MESSIKKQVNKFLSFFMAMAMVLTSMTITPLTANAEEGAGTVSGNDVSGNDISLYFKLPADTTLADWGFNCWGDVTVKDAGEEGVVGGTWGAQNKPTLLDGENGFGYVSVTIAGDGSESGIQFVKMLGADAEKTEAPTVYACWDENLVDSELKAAYFNPADSNWYKDAALTEKLGGEDLGIHETDKTKLKVYYYISEDSDTTFGDYAVNLWGGPVLTEAGPFLNITAWAGQKYRTLLDANLTNTVADMPGKWGYVGLDGSKIEGLQFLTVDGGENIWNAAITEMGLTEVYYVSGYGWFKDAACEEEIKALELQEDEFYIIGATSYLGNWKLEDAVKMEKTGDKQYEVTISLPAGTYEYTPVQDPKQFSWEHQYKDYENEWANYTLTLEKDGDVVFTVKNPDPATGKAEVTAKVKEDETPTPPVVEVKKYTVTFKDGDKVLKTETVESGKAATAPALPTKTGYTASWDKAFANVTADVVVSVKWTANTYTLTYNVNGGTKLKVATKAVVYDGTYGELAKPVRKGYAFKGWYTAKTKGTKVTSSTKVTGNATIYAQWTKVTKPGKVSIKSVKNSAKKTMKVTLKKVKGADGYEVRYSTKKNMKGAKKSTSKKTTLTIKKLKKGKTYYVQARAYKLDSAGKKIYSAKYSATKKVKIKK